eukprot:scaffold135027_cov17-Prasinocladus_malaysianus.AAC.1
MAWLHKFFPFIALMLRISPTSVAKVVSSAGLTSILEKALANARRLISSRLLYKWQLNAP